VTSRAEHLVDPRASILEEILRAALIVMLRELAVTAAVVAGYGRIATTTVVAVGLPLETIDVGQVGSDDVPLIAHHAHGEEAEEQGLDGESHEREEVGGMVDAAGTVVVGVDVTDAVYESVYDEEEGVEAGEAGVKDEEEEVLVIANSHAVINPRAVMIHFYDASLADTAVMRSGRLERLTPPTHSPPPLLLSRRRSPLLPVSPFLHPRRRRHRRRRPGGAHDGTRHARRSGHRRDSRNERRSYDCCSYRSCHGYCLWHCGGGVVVVVVR